MSFEEVEAKFKTVWEQIKGGVSKISKGEAAWLKRKGIRSEQENAKKQKTIEENPFKSNILLLTGRPATDEKEMKLWVELKRLYEPNVEDHIWTHSQHIMHAPVDWRLYDTCGVHHVMFKDLGIFMLVEKNYPLRKALALVMICYKLQVENYSQMATDQVRKI
nr:hypothetical protein [Tanacetum cinerariifolium]